MGVKDKEVNRNMVTHTYELPVFKNRSSQS